MMMVNQYEYENKRENYHLVEPLTTHRSTAFAIEAENSAFGNSSLQEGAEYSILQNSEKWLFPVFNKGKKLRIWTCYCCVVLIYFIMYVHISSVILYTKKFTPIVLQKLPYLSLIHYYLTEGGSGQRRKTAAAAVLTTQSSLLSCFQTTHYKIWPQPQHTYTHTLLFSFRPIVCLWQWCIPDKIQVQHSVVNRTKANQGV